MAAIRGIPIIIGGVHATLSPQQAFKDFPKAYAIVREPGEYPTINILEGKQTNVPGVYFKEDNNSNRQDYAYPYPINQIPPINYAIWVPNPLTERKIETPQGKKTVIKEISLFESYGCPFECTYCSTPVLIGRGQGRKTYSKPSTEKIMQDVKLALKTDANAIHFLDDMFFISPQDFIEFYEALSTLNLSEFYWRGMTRAPIIERFTDDQLKLLPQSGAWRISIGVESGDEEILKRIKKHIHLDQVRRTVFRLRQAGIPQVKAFFIMGFPDESLEQIENTRRFIMELKELGLTEISLFQFKPYPGTEEWNYLQEKKPHVLKNLSYMRRGDNKKMLVDAKLPDNLQISQVPSRIVEEVIEQTLREFYGK